VITLGINMKPINTEFSVLIVKDGTHGYHSALKGEDF
jgi:hypothetical protein